MLKKGIDQISKDSVRALYEKKQELTKTFEVRNYLVICARYAERLNLNNCSKHPSDSIFAKNLS